MLYLIPLSEYFYNFTIINEFSEKTARKMAFKRFKNNVCLTLLNG